MELTQPSAGAMEVHVSLLIYMKKGEEGGETPPPTHTHLSLDPRPLLEQCPGDDEDWVDVRCPGMLFP